jgi:hypothetical protein
MMIIGLTFDEVCFISGGWQPCRCTLTPTYNLYRDFVGSADIALYWCCRHMRGTHYALYDENMNQQEVGSCLAYKWTEIAKFTFEVFLDWFANGCQGEMDYSAVPSYKGTKY